MNIFLNTKVNLKKITISTDEAPLPKTTKKLLSDYLKVLQLVSVREKKLIHSSTR